MGGIMRKGSPIQGWRQEQAAGSEEQGWDGGTPGRGDEIGVVRAWALLCFLPRLLASCFLQHEIYPQIRTK